MPWKNKKRIIIEALLVLIILIQFGVIYFLWEVARGNLFADALEFTEEMGCAETAGFIFEYHENSQFEAVISLGEYLYRNGFKDKILLHLLAEAHFVTGGTKQAAEYLEKALDTGYFCKILKPKLVESKEFDEAIARYQLSEIYSLLGDKDKANKELLNAQNIMKRIYSDRYKLEIVEKMFKDSSLYKAREKFINKKNS